VLALDAFSAGSRDEVLSDPPDAPPETPVLPKRSRGSLSSGSYGPAPAMAGRIGPARDGNPPLSLKSVLPPVDNSIQSVMSMPNLQAGATLFSSPDRSLPQAPAVEGPSAVRLVQMGEDPREGWILRFLERTRTPEAKAKFRMVLSSYTAGQLEIEHQRAVQEQQDMVRCCGAANATRNCEPTSWLI
jgi:hypothetical protein